MRYKIKNLTLLVLLMLFWGMGKGYAIDVTLTIDEHVTAPAGLNAAERNLAQILTEINRAQRAHAILELGGLKMDEFAKKSLASIWAVTQFVVDDEEIV